MSGRLGGPRIRGPRRSYPPTHLQPSPALLPIAGRQPRSAWPHPNLHRWGFCSIGTKDRTKEQISYQVWRENAVIDVKVRHFDEVIWNSVSPKVLDSSLKAFRDAGIGLISVFRTVATETPKTIWDCWYQGRFPSQTHTPATIAMPNERISPWPVAGGSRAGRTFHECLPENA